MRKFLLLLFFIAILSKIYSGESLIFGCDRSESSFAEHNKRTTLIGNAYIKTETLEIKADEIDLYGKDYRFASCTNNIEIYNSKDNFYITSDKLHYDNEKKEVTVTGNAVMKDIKNDMIIKSEFIKSYEKTSITLIQIKVRIINEDLVCRSEFAEFNSKENKLILTGDPIVYKGDDVFMARKIKIDLDNNNITMEGRVKGNISEKEGRSDSE